MPLMLIIPDAVTLGFLFLALVVIAGLVLRVIGLERRVSELQDECATLGHEKLYLTNMNKAGVLSMPDYLNNYRN